MRNELYKYFSGFSFHGCIHYYCNNSGMDFHYSARIPKGLAVWVCKKNGEFEWYRHRLLGGTTNVCERFLLERIALFFPCLFELTT